MNYDDITIETTAPKPWEHEETFNDVLYDWMQRAPWLAISAAGHLIVFLIIQAIPWNLFVQKPEVIIEAKFKQAPEEAWIEPEPETPLEVEDEPIEDEPVVQDIEIEQSESDTDDEAMEVGDPDFISNSPFDKPDIGNLIGLGGDPGGKLGGRFDGDGGRRKSGGAGTEQALRDGLEWLQRHQSRDGSWDCDGFNEQCGQLGSDECGGQGDALHDVGVTALALLAFLGDGHTMRRGAYKDSVTRAVKWLRAEQDYETGLIGEEIHHAFLYDHAIATLALCEAYYFSKSPLLKGTAQKAVNYILAARDPYGAWRYDVPSIGDSDTSITGWMVFALKSAEEAGLRVEQGAFDAALTWIDEMTDPASGRVGYIEQGGMSSRITGVNDAYPTAGSEAMTAVALLSRFFLGQDPKNTPEMEQHADLMLRSLPEWDSKGLSNDMYYWYYGSYAMYQMGGRHWRSWNQAMRAAVQASQRKDGDANGSWDPNGPWGHAGGRVYSTASLILCLEVYYRYSRVLGAR